jgi:hypothetical protein
MFQREAQFRFHEMPDVPAQRDRRRFVVGPTDEVVHVAGIRLHRRLPLAKPIQRAEVEIRQMLARQAADGQALALFRAVAAEDPLQIKAVPAAIRDLLLEEGVHALPHKSRLIVLDFDATGDPCDLPSFCPAGTGDELLLTVGASTTPWKHMVRATGLEPEHPCEY